MEKITVFKNKKIDAKYWSGAKNKTIRYYFYAQRGLTLMNEFRYVIMTIFAVYFTLKLTNILLIPLMFVLAIPFLCIAGYISVHHMAKVIEYLNIEFSTHWGRYTYELNEKRNELLEEISDGIKKDGK